MIARAIHSIRFHCLRIESCLIESLRGEWVGKENFVRFTALNAGWLMNPLSINWNLIRSPCHSAGNLTAHSFQHEGLEHWRKPISVNRLCLFLNSPIIGRICMKKLSEGSYDAELFVSIENLHTASSQRPFSRGVSWSWWAFCLLSDSHR